MDESSSGFGEESPILFKYPKASYEIHSLKSNFTIEELHKELLLHLKKSKSFTKEELKSFWDQVNKIEAEDPKNRWLLKKVKGLLTFILKKRAEFQNSIVKGKIVIYEKSNCGPSPLMTNVSRTPSRTNSVYKNEDVAMPSCLLTNNDFVSMDVAENQKVTEKESDNYSQDLFNSDTAENLHAYAHENFQLLKTLTQNSVLPETSDAHMSVDDSQVFKVPPEVINTKIENVYQVHEKIEEDYKSLVSLTPDTLSNAYSKCSNSISENNASDNAALKENAENVNIFDKLVENDGSLKSDFKDELEKTEKWVNELISNLMKMDVKRKRKPRTTTRDDKENLSLLNESFETSASGELKTYYSEENFKTIRETCLRFKENLKMKKNLEVLKDFDYSF